MSELTERRCLTDIPNVEYLTVKGLKELCDTDALLVTISLKILGDVVSDVIVIMQRSDAPRLVSYVTKAENQVNRTDWNFTAQAALKQIGERVTTAFARAFSEFLQTKPVLTRPLVTIDAWQGGIKRMFTRLYDGAEQVLVLHTVFSDAERTFEGRVLCIMQQASATEVLRRLDVLRAG